MAPKEEQKDCQNGLKIGREQVKFVNIIYVNSYPFVEILFSILHFLPFQLD